MGIAKQKSEDAIQLLKSILTQAYRKKLALMYQARKEGKALGALL